MFVLSLQHYKKSSMNGERKISSLGSKLQEKKLTEGICLTSYYDQKPEGAIRKESNGQLHSTVNEACSERCFI